MICLKLVSGTFSYNRNIFNSKVISGPVFGASTHLLSLGSFENDSFQ